MTSDSDDNVAAVASAIVVGSFCVVRNLFVVILGGTVAGGVFGVGVTINSLRF